MISFGAFFFMGMIVTITAVFKEYCTPGLCEYSGGDGMHTGCRNGVLHDGKLQKSCSKDAYMIDIDAYHKKLILDYHNEHRDLVAGGDLIKIGINSACRMGAVVWNEELKLSAELHARECIFGHDKCRNTINYPLAGQNLGIVTYMQQKKLNITDRILAFMNGWYDENKFVKQKTVDIFAKSPPSDPMIGHWLTMVNERNNRVGCTSVCFRKTSEKLQYMLTCNYCSTSITGGTIYNSCKTPGLKCTSGKHPKYRNLCNFNEEYNYQGKLELLPYDSTVVADSEIAKENSREVAEDEGDDDYDEEELAEADKVVNDFNASFSGSITIDVWNYCLLLSCFLMYFLG